MTELIIYEDGTRCNPFIEDCPIPMDDDDVARLVESGFFAAAEYAAIAFFAALLPPIIY